MKKLYRCIVQCGHMGAGNSSEKVVYVRANSSADAMLKASRLPGVKRKSIGGVLSVVEEKGK